MSLIKKIVEIVEKSDNVDARKNILKLNKEIKIHKEKVKQYIDANYVDFMPTIVNNESLLDEGKRFGEELSSVEQNLNNDLMYQANDEISKHVEELDEAKLKLSLSLKLMKIEKLLGKIKLYNEMKKYAEISSTINAIQLLVNDPEDRIIRRLDMYQNLKARIATERDNMLRNLEKRFHDMVHIKAKSFLKTRAITMKITKDNVKLAASANAIIDTDYNFQSLADSFMNNIFEPVISRAVSLEIGENEQSFSLSLSYSTEVITDELRPNYGAVFANLRNILSFLLNMNVQLKTGDYFLAYIFDSHRQQLQELIFNNCLAHSIPKTFEEMNQCTMKADITKLSQLFAESNFFSESSEPQLEDYAAKVDELFYQEFTKTIQASVSELLKRDLHDMMLIDEDSTLSTTTPLTFPRSMVSKSTLELIRLLEKIIKQTDDANNQSNLMMSIRSVLENYTFTIQLHHSKFMSKIPQQSALFYNNCMYLSNWVSTIREMSNCKMDHLTSSLESQGWEVLECQIAKQKIQLLEILSAFDPSQGLNAVTAEHFKPIRQCLRQLELLKNVWQTILSAEMYNKTISSLLDVMSSDLIKKVLLMEDISTTLANGLVELIRTIDDKAQSLFEADTSVLNVVTSWQKLLHLQFLLDASLVDITNSWKSGQVSQSFKADEVKRMIRALFQNTDRRSKALSSIV